MSQQRKASATTAGRVPGEDVIRVLIVDDHDVVRDGLRALLETQPGLEIVGEAATEQDAVREALCTRPDVVVMDVRLGDGSGVTATREIRSQLHDTRVLMLTSYADDEALTASVLAGASGYVLKEVRGGDIVSGIRRVAAGESLFDQADAASAIVRLAKGKHLNDARLFLLSPQEERVAELIAQGMTNAEIAGALEIAEKTVKNYVSNVLMKLDVGRRAEAAAYLARHTRAAG